MSRDEAVGGRKASCQGETATRQKLQQWSITPGPIKRESRARKNCFSPLEKVNADLFKGESKDGRELHVSSTVKIEDRAKGGTEFPPEKRRGSLANDFRGDKEDTIRRLGYRHSEGTTVSVEHRADLSLVTEKPWLPLLGEKPAGMLENRMNVQRNALARGEALEISKNPIYCINQPSRGR